MEEILAAIRQSAETKSILRGSILYSATTHSDPIYFLEQGYAKISSTSPSQRETIFRCVGPGTILGYSALNGEARMRCSAHMLTAGVVREIPAVQFDRLLNTDFRIWKWLAQQEAKRREALERRLEILGLADANRRIRALLPQLVKECGFPQQPDGSFTIPLKQSDLANLAAVTRETASCTLNIMSREKLIEILRGRLVIPNLGALEAA